MDSDRELLALAAKAAGLDIVWNPPEHPVAGWHCATGESWDALLDDGDALRLAVSLGMIVDTSRPSAGEPFKRHHCGQEDFADPFAATRRAIVRAAAELGRRG